MLACGLWTGRTDSCSNYISGLPLKAVTGNRPGQLLLILILSFMFQVLCVCFFLCFAGKHLELEWMLPILVRNTIVTLVTCGFWDWFLYYSPLKDKLHKYKVDLHLDVFSRHQSTKA